MLFPVKPVRNRVPWGAALALTLCACGYRSPGTVPVAERLSLAAGPLATPHLEAMDAALSGARTELLRQQALGSESYPRLVVEIVRVDELPSGVMASSHPGGAIPLARASDVGVVGRGYVLTGPDAAPTRDTGDLRRVETVVQGAEPVHSAAAYSEAIRAAARRVGEGISRRVLGHAEPGLDPM